MKFPARLQTECYPEWQSAYLAYARLKQSVEASSRKHARPRLSLKPVADTVDAEAVDTVEALIEDELARIVSFYYLTEAQLASEQESLLAESSLHSSFIKVTEVDLSGDATAEEAEPLTERKASAASLQACIHRLIDLHIRQCALAHYVELNQMGFEEILGMYAKHSDHVLFTDRFRREKLEVAVPFTESERERQNVLIRKTEAEYFRLTGHEFRGTRIFNHAASATRSRALSLKEYRRASIGNLIEHEARKRTMTNPSCLEKQSMSHGKRRRHWLLKIVPKNAWMALLSLIVFVVLLEAPTFPQEAQQNCLALLVFVSLLWATEAIPLFATAMLVPFLVVVLRVLQNAEGVRLSAKESTKVVFSAMFTPMIMLMLGGFALAAALEKHGLARRVAHFVLSRAGSRPSVVILVSMFLSNFISIFVSNITAPILCFSLIQPLLERLPAESPVAKALILGIAFAADLGGMASPIASPQTLIGLEIMKPPPSWPVYFAIALPLCIGSIFIIWGFLMLIYRPGRQNVSLALPKPVEETAPEKLVSFDLPRRRFAFLYSFTSTQWYVLVISVITIALWCAESGMDQVVGHMGVVSIFPLLALFGTGILTKDDFNGFLWTVVMLAQGGMALGKAVESSGLLNTIALAIRDVVADFPVYAVMWIFAIVMTIVSTFISHTVAALIFLPVVYQVGAALPDPHPGLLVLMTTFYSSVGMGLPVSGFPNMNAIMIEDARGDVYLRSWDFIKTGIPASIAVAGLIGTLGYGLVYAFGY